MSVLRKSLRTEGFTIIELLIATTIFGLILLVVTYGLLQIGRLYYKGITQARTQDTARAVMDDISRSIQFTNFGVRENLGGTFKTYCIGQLRYSFVLNMQVKANPTNGMGDPVNPQVRHGLWLDKVDSSTEYCDPLDLNQLDPSACDPLVCHTVPSFNQNREFLAENMRLLQFEIVRYPTLNRLHSIKIMVGYGDRDLLNTNGTADPSDDLCFNTTIGGQFCATSKLYTTVTKRII